MKCFIVHTKSCTLIIKHHYIVLRMTRNTLTEHNVTESMLIQFTVYVHVFEYQPV